MLTLEQANKALAAVVSRAKGLKISVSVAIVDDVGNLVAFNRMDGALSISTKFARSKALTSASLGMPSDDLAQYASEGKPYFGLNTAFGGELMCIAGGLPIILEGKLVGGVGVGGAADVSQDKLLAGEGIKAICQ